MELGSNLRISNNQKNLSEGMSKITILESLNEQTVDKARLCRPNEKLFVLKKVYSKIDSKKFQFE